MPDVDCLFALEKHGEGLALRNRGSGLFVSAEDHGLRADRKEYKAWEMFVLEVIRVEPSLEQRQKKRGGGVS